jgi:hypothetical protein
LTLVEHHLLIASLKLLLTSADRELKVLELMGYLIRKLLILKVALVEKTHLVLLIAAHLLILVILRHLVLHSVMAHRVVTFLVTMVVPIVAVVAEVVRWTDTIEAATPLVTTPTAFITSVELLRTLLVILPSAVIWLHRITFFKLIINLARH